MKPAQKPGTNTVPQIQPEPAITPSHYGAAVKHKGSTIRTPVREATTPTPGAPPKSQEGQGGVCDWYTVVLGVFEWTTLIRQYLEDRSRRRQAVNVNTTKTDQAQTLRLFVERTERECEQKQDQMQGHRQTSQEYGMEVETEVPLGVS